MKKLILMLLAGLVMVLFLVSSCSGPVAGQVTGPKETLCSNNLDDDSDGKKDCADIDCSSKLCGADKKCYQYSCITLVCGNNKAEGGELCDGTNLKGKTCNSMGKGYTGGTLACNQYCTGFIITGCIAPACDAQHLDLCTTQSACTAVGVWSNGVCVASCPAGTEAGADKVCQTCTAGATGKIKCVQEKTTFYAVKELKNSDCTASLATKWPDKTYCGVEASSCKEDVGCCVDKVLSSVCDGNTQVNQTQNVCTGETKDIKTDCSSFTGYIDGKSQVCVTKDSMTSCAQVCTPGETVITCNKYNTYNSYTCDPNKLYYILGSNKVSKCPEGQTCKLFTGKNNGLCATGEVSTSINSFST